jgi:serine/threonine protein kinase
MRPSSAASRGDDQQQQQQQATFKPQDRYILLQEIGKGNFGCVYKGIDSVSSTLVAVKIIDLERTTDDIEDIQVTLSLRGLKLLHYA